MGDKLKIKNIHYGIVCFLLTILTVGILYTIDIDIKVFAGEVFDVIEVSDSVKKSTNNFVEKKSYDDGTHKGIKQLDHVQTVTKTEYDTEYKFYTTTLTNECTRYYNPDGSFDHAEYSWDDSNNHSEIDVNSDGYTGIIPQVSVSAGSVRVISEYEDGTIKVTKQDYVATYEGTLSKTVSWTVNEFIAYYTGHAYSQEIIVKNYGEVPNSEGVNEPVNIVTGNYYAKVQDLSIPDIGQNLTIERFYNALDKRDSIIGKGWRLNYDTIITENSTTGDVSIIYPDGRTVIFDKVDGTDEYQSPETVFDILTKNIDGTFILELQNKLTYTYNSSGKLTSIIDQNNNQVTLTYDVSDNLDTVTGEGGKSLTFGYENGKLKTITDQLNRTITYNYDSLGNLQEVIDTGNNKTIYNYNSYGITTITDGNNKVFIENQYDEFGRVIRQYDEERNEIRYDYDDIDRMNTYTFVSTGKNISYYYNDKLYITKKVFDDGTYEEYTYDEWGNKASIRDKNGNITNYLYDQRGNLLKVTSPAPFNYETSYEYDADYNLIEVTSTPSGAITEFNYDTKGNLLKNIIKIDDTTNLENTYTYDLNGRVETISDLTGKLITYQYENHKYPVKIIEKVSDTETNEVSYTYDAIGRKKTVTTEYGTTTLHYNDIDKIIKIVDASGNITRMKYDNEGNLIKLIKPEQYNEITDDGIGTTFEYDGMDRLLREIDPLGNTLAKKYDAEGNVIKQINPNYYNSSTDDGTGIGYEYDKTGRLVKIVNPSGEKSRIVYDGVGNQTKVINANNYNESTDSGQGVQYEYDSLNRLTKVIDTEGNVIAKLLYDSMGNVIKSIDGKGYLSGIDDNSRYGTTYKYNLAGWLLEERVPVKEENGTIYYNISRYSYDNSGKLIEEKKSPEYVTIDGEPTVWNTITYTYYLNGKVKTISDSTGAYIEYTYDSLGNTISQKAKIDDSKYSVKGYHYNNLGKLDRQWTEIEGTDLKDGVAGKILAETIYEYDKNGNITKVTSPEGYITQFVYNEADQLIEKIEEVPEDYIDIKGATATVTSPRRIIYPGEQYDYKVKINPDGEITAINMDIDYDVRMFEKVNVTPETTGLTINNDTLGKITIDGTSANITNETTLATIKVKAKDTVTGTGYIKVNPLSTYTDVESNEYNFIESSGKTAIIKTPDMNDDQLVETKDFTLTALLKDIDKTSLKYNEKYDITGNDIIDTPDLDYIKDWLFEDKDNNITALETEKFYEKYITPVYQSSSSTVNRITKYTYDKAGNIIEETECYDKTGDLIEEPEYTRNKVIYRYDEYNRLISVTNKEISTGIEITSRVFYDEVGNVIKEVLPENYDLVADDGIGTTYQYDSMNRLIEVINEEGNVVQKNIYDVNGLKIKTIDGKGYLSATNDNDRYGIEYTYDIGNRIKTITTPESKEIGKVSVEYTYNAMGNILTYKDGEGNTTTYERDLWGNATKIIDGEGIETNYSYDYAGNLISSTDGENNITTYTYNSMNLLSSITDPLGQTITYKYDKEGRLRQEIDRNGQTILYDYNRDNNLVLKRMSDGSLEEKYLYNKDGSLLAAINSSGIETFEYTFNGYIKNKSRNGQNILSYEYNNNGSVEAVIDQTGARTEYIHDTLGRLQTVKDGTQEIASYNYNIDNTISQVNYHTGINISYQYDRDKNIENLTSKDPQNNIIKELEYSYYNNGNVKTKIENGNTTAYTYDKADRLKIENNPTAGLIVYSYDNAHNMLSKKVGEDETTYSYDVNNRLLQSTNNSVITDYTYDNNGNLLREETGTEYTNYIYDGFNKLKEVNKSNGSWMYNEYSALGLRIATEENGVRAEFTFDRGSIITEVDSNNELIARSIRGLGLIAQKDNRNVLSYYLHNAHGDVTNLVDGNGQVLNSYEYDAFGNTLNYSEKVANRFMYTGEQFDKVTGHYYLRARYYAPSIARFTQEDTYRGDGLNLYGYVSNNPVRYVDPSGHCKDGAGNKGKSNPTFWSATGNFFGGMWDGGKDTVSGLWYMTTHPLHVIDNLDRSIMDLDRTLEAIYNSIETTINEQLIYGDADTRARLAGRATFEILAAVVGAKGLDKLSKAEKISDVGRVTNYIDDIAVVSDDASRYIDDVINSADEIVEEIIEETSKATNTVWDNIKITQPMYKNTKIPKSFELAVGNDKFWVHPNGTKHMVEYVTRSTTHGMPMNSQTLLSSFQQSVSKAVQQGVKYDEIMNSGNWELIFSKPRGDGLLPVIKHAVYRP